ncbi:hypothetical protein NDU88_002837 [Pleurodeles waltl]|uniref:Uncharacterized protein n=1 Tax=Pleurodeles waltl TaxID=8319 RepID=A0AAV7TMZ2_PLEWA|nr:hypothetical protein NDU88_002837 [Pleurodeles waltl]
MKRVWGLRAPRVLYEWSNCSEIETGLTLSSCGKQVLAFGEPLQGQSFFMSQIVVMSMRSGPKFVLKLEKFGAHRFVKDVNAVIGR